ncbi:hypothetical protein G9A89_003419 [Geosiphon pyriformis]|nr:hypothetical protein G9A89_003419 [Geosiphon pyriformis]
MNFWYRLVFSSLIILTTILFLILKIKSLVKNIPSILLTDIIPKNSFKLATSNLDQLILKSFSHDQNHKVFFKRSESPSKILITNENELKTLSLLAYISKKGSCLKNEDQISRNLFMGIITILSPPTLNLPPTRVFFFDARKIKKNPSVILEEYPGGPGTKGMKVDKDHYARWSNALRNPRKLVQTTFEKFHRMNPLYKLSTHCYFVFTGFGEGGVFAIFAALSYGKRYRKIPVVVTFGQPKMSNSLFADLVSTQLKLYRVTYADDNVPAFPLNNEYWPLPTEFWIPDDNSCDCNPSIGKFPKVYMCEQKGTKELNTKCNAQFHSKSLKKVKDSFVPNRIHFGPYFGYKMGQCDNNPYDTLEMIFLSLVEEKPVQEIDSP